MRISDWSSDVCSSDLLQFSPRGVPGLNFRGTVNYSHARYGSFLAPCYSGESIAAGCNTTFRGGTGQRLDGQPTTNSPPWPGSLGGKLGRAQSRESVRQYV